MRAAPVFLFLPPIALLCGAHSAARMQNFCLHIAYDGTDFKGWQRQNREPTVQAFLEKALDGILGRPVAITASGRTDAGVHATDQVANFRTDCRIPCKNLQRALNHLLPPTVRVTKLEEAPPDFHARFGVRAKIYRYRILQSPICPPFLARFVYHYPHQLNRGSMAEAARQFLGEHDFTSFAAADSEKVFSGRGPAVRTVFRSRVLWRQKSSILIYEVSGSGFLHHMVRNIAGTLIEVGRGRTHPDEIPRILEARNRSFAGPTAPARGLCLVKVDYGGSDL